MNQLSIDLGLRAATSGGNTNLFANQTQEENTDLFASQNTTLFPSEESNPVENTDLFSQQASVEGMGNMSLFPAQEGNTDLFANTEEENTDLFANTDEVVGEPSLNASDVVTQMNLLSQLLTAEGYTNLAASVTSLQEIYNEGL